MSSGWLAITKASSLDNSRDWVLNTPCQSFPDSTTPSQRSMDSKGPEIWAQAVKSRRHGQSAPFHGQRSAGHGHPDGDEGSGGLQFAFFLRVLFSGAEFKEVLIS